MSDAEWPASQRDPVDAELAALAAVYGVATSYEDSRGQQVPVAASTVRAVLAAMDVAAADDAQVRSARRHADESPWRRVITPGVVVRRARLSDTRLLAHVPDGAPVRVTAHLEDGTARPLPVVDAPVTTRVLDGRRHEARAVHLPDDLPLGWHGLTVACGGDPLAESTLVVAPDQCPLPLVTHRRGAGTGARHDGGDGARTWGWMIQLYALRSRASWGIGDFGDLAALARWSGDELGAGVVVCNPVHAAAPVTPRNPSPYFPSSRRFHDPLYLRVQDVEELATANPTTQARITALAQRAHVLNTADRIDRDAVMAAKTEALELLHAADRSPAREAALAAYRAREGSELTDFATFCALAERHGTPFHEWPAPLRHPRSSAVEAARRELTGRVAYHSWLQWLCDQQLGAAQDTARRSGMPVGIVHDLAVGVDPGGADAWALQDTLAIDVTVGAPPDAFNRRGQDWALPPLRPDRLAATGYAPLRSMLRSVLRHAGGIRIDHVLGLFRLYWIPEGAPASAGTYVRYPADELLGVLALEAARADALVVGEDLGTVEPGVRDTLAERGALGSKVIYFERTPTGERLPAGAYPRLALASVNTHDLPTAAGWWSDEEVRVQAELGLLGDSTEAAERERKARERAELLDLLRAEGLVSGDAAQTGSDLVADHLVTAMHAFLARTPSLLVAGSLGDVLGDRRQPNLPGTVDEYPNWRLPLATPAGDGHRPVLLDDLRDEFALRVRRHARALGHGRTRPG